MHPKHFFLSGTISATQCKGRQENSWNLAQTEHHQTGCPTRTSELLLLGYLQLFSSEGCRRDQRNPTVPFHWLARPRCATPCHRPAGLHPACEGQDSTHCRPHRGPLQVVCVPTPVMILLDDLQLTCVSVCFGESVREQDAQAALLWLTLCWTWQRGRAWLTSTTVSGNWEHGGSTWSRLRYTTPKHKHNWVLLQEWGSA